MPTSTRDVAPSNPSRPGPVLCALRRATSSVHRRIESRLAIGRGYPPAGTVVRYLECMHAWLDHVEPRLWITEDWAGALSIDRRKTKVAWLVEDLGRTEPKHGTPSPPLLLDTPSARAGVAYLIEGSTLGGTVLAQRCAPTPDARSASRFLRGYGKETQKMWVEFVAALEHPRSPARNLRAAAESAHHAFCALEQWFDTCGVMA